MVAFDESKVSRTRSGRFMAPANSVPEATLGTSVDAMSLANTYHEQWREARRRPDGSFEPRVKVTTDQTWIDERGQDTVDIANTAFDALPADWRAENEAAALVVVEYLASQAVDLEDPSSRSAAGQYVHKAWLSRNGWAHGGELDVHFDDLPLSEQEKDIDQVRLALT